VNDDSGSTQILTQYYGAQSQTVSPLESSGTTPTRQVLAVQPLRVIKILEDGVGAFVAPH
jgi:hypothetical protein